MNDWEKAKRQLKSGIIPRITEGDNPFGEEKLFDAYTRPDAPESPEIIETRQKIKARCIELGLTRSESEDLIFMQFGTFLDELTGIHLLNCLDWVNKLD